MVRLTRTVRFNSDAGAVRSAAGGASGAGVGVNGFGGVPAMEGLGAHYEMVVEVSGEPSRATGYLINIKDIDRAVRDACVPMVGRAVREGGRDAAGTLAEMWTTLAASLSVRLCGLRWRLTPYLSVERSAEAGEVRAMGSSVILRQQFDLAAAHRLHSLTLSEEENRRLFGKCNNPNGHGHNYRVEAAFALASGDGKGRSASVNAGELERLVQEAIIERYDHKHLNLDCPEFDEARGGVNPSVEHIARVFFERLAPRVDAWGGGASRGVISLRSVTVWETDRTSATYPG